MKKTKTSKLSGAPTKAPVPAKATTSAKAAAPVVAEKATPEEPKVAEKAADVDKGSTSEARKPDSAISTESRSEAHPPVRKNKGKKDMTKLQEALQAKKKAKKTNIASRSEKNDLKTSSQHRLNQKVWRLKNKIREYALRIAQETGCSVLTCVITPSKHMFIERDSTMDGLVPFVNTFASKEFNIKSPLDKQSALEPGQRRRKQKAKE